VPISRARRRSCRFQSPAGCWRTRRWCCGYDLPVLDDQYRAITGPALHHAAYALIIAAEAVTAILCWIGAGLLVHHIRSDASAFNRAKTLAVLGLTLGFLLWQVGFMSIGGEWFGMWQSEQWNGVPSAFRFLMTIVAVLLFVAMPDQEFERPGAA
jgi:predicted small integral membrane protein